MPHLENLQRKRRPCLVFETEQDSPSLLEYTTENQCQFSTADQKIHLLSMNLSGKGLRNQFAPCGSHVKTIIIDERLIVTERLSGVC